MCTDTLGAVPDEVSQSPFMQCLSNGLEFRVFARQHQHCLLFRMRHEDGSTELLRSGTGPPLST